MISPLERKVQLSDYTRIKSACEQKLRQLKRQKAKLWINYISIDDTMNFIMKHDGSYILDESYLVVYSLGSPWYNRSIIMLEEMIVLRLAEGGDFAAVSAFFDRKAVEAGAVLQGVGTALTRYDNALASFYKQAGYSQGAIILEKETNVR